MEQIMSHISSLFGSVTEFAGFVSIRKRFGALKLKNLNESVVPGTLLGSLSSAVGVAKSDGAKVTKPCKGIGWQDDVQARIASILCGNTRSNKPM
jgi:hypothetical protein